MQATRDAYHVSCQMYQITWLSSLVVKSDYVHASTIDTSMIGPAYKPLLHSINCTGNIFACNSNVINCSNECVN